MKEERIGCEFCYYEYFDGKAYPCSMCIRGEERADKFEPKGRQNKRKTEPTISKMEQVDEPQIERKCIDCKFLTYMFGKTWCNIKCENPHDEVCDRFKPKDNPQTDCAWR